MKLTRIFYFIIVLISFNSFAQVCVGEADYMNENSKKNDIKDIERLKKTKTIFVLSDMYSKQEYDNILNKYWKTTNYEIITTKEFKDNPTKYKQLSNSIFEFRSYVLSTTFSGTSRVIKDTNHLFILCDLYIFDDIKEKSNGTIKYKTTSLATIFFTPNSSSKTGESLAEISKITLNDLLNYKLGYLQNYIQFINDNLLLNSNFNCFDDFVNKDKLKALQTNKLIICDEITKKFNAYSMTVGKDRKIEEMLEKYTYKYEVLSNEAINKKILNKENFYYLIYSQINAKKIISVINSKTGEIIYNIKERMSYNIEPDDFKELNKCISKS